MLTTGSRLLRLSSPHHHHHHHHHHHPHHSQRNIFLLRRQPFSSFATWNSSVTNHDENESKNVKSMTLTSSSSSTNKLISLNPIMFQTRQYSSHNFIEVRKYFTYNNRRNATMNNRMHLHFDKKSFFSTTAAGSGSGTNNDRTFQTNEKQTHKTTSVGSGSKDSETRRDKARKFAKKGATQARKGGSKMKELLSKYGWYFGGTYFCVYAVSLGSFYTALDTGFLDPNVITSFWEGDAGGDMEEELDAVKMVANILEKWEWTRPYSDKVEQNPRLTTLAVAWIGTKIIEPARIGLSVFITPKLAKAMGKNVEDEQDEDTITFRDEEKRKTGDKGASKNE